MKLVLTALLMVLTIAGISAKNVHAAGEVAAWGYNWYGQLGDGTFSGDKPTPVQVLGLTGVTAVAGGYLHSLALKNDGTVWAWGHNGSGQLGDGTFSGDKPTPVQVLGLTNVTAIAGRSAHSLALKNDGTIWAWGDNYYGQLGDGTTETVWPYGKSTPVQVLGLTGITAVAVGDGHSLALKNDGTVWAWGYNWYGRLGDGTNNSSNIPVHVLGLTGITAVAVGGGHSLAIKNDGTVWAWGYNCWGQLGDGTTNSSNIPVQVLGLTGITTVSAGIGHSLALKKDGTVWAWGANWGGQIGDGTGGNWDLGNDKSIPVQVLGLTGITAVAGGMAHSLAIKSDGTVWAWGYNGGSQLGDGTNNTRLTPVQVAGLTEATAVAGGGWHSLAIGHIVPIDTTPPVITITNPVAGDYPISNSIIVGFTVTDEGSGVGAVSANIDGRNVASGDTIKLYELGAGSHTLTVQASDIAGNTSSKTVTFNVTVSSASLIELIWLFYNMGLIDNKGTATSLAQQIQNGAIGAFINYLDAQTGKNIDPYAADILKSAALTLP
ncbi:MAG: hypothetical protein HZB81_04475 [Deltaproteobacteria bacterium]|nr:hypothetical protein [Deltaproteobacteria bacterium]